MGKFEEAVGALRVLGEEELEIIVEAAKRLAAEITPDVRDAARQAVTEAAQLAIPGAEKKEVAFKQIGAELLIKGIVVGVQIAVETLYEMIEAAYRWFMREVVGIVPGAPATGSPIGTA